MTHGRRQRARGFLVRLVPFGTLAGITTLLATTHDLWPVAVPFGLGAVFAGKRLLDREGNRRRELERRVRNNTRELMRVAREDRSAAPQMKRLAASQEGILNSLELMPEGYGPLMSGDLSTILDEVESAAYLARRRAALRRYLASVDRDAVSLRVRGLERDLAELEADSRLRMPFESALTGRREELAGFDDVRDGISVINAQLEGVESLLGGLRGELLALNSRTSAPLDSELARIREKVSYFRKGLNEVTRSVDTTVEELSAFE